MGPTASLGAGQTRMVVDMGLVATPEQRRADTDARWREMPAPLGCRVVVAAAEERDGLSLTVALDGRGWSVSPCVFEKLASSMRRRTPDLAVVRPSCTSDAVAVARKLRSTGSAVPLVVIIDAAGPEDRAEVLSAGADECLTLPMSTDELVARMHAVHRRPRKAVRAAVTVGSLSLDPENGTLCLPSGTVHITKQQFAILLALARHLDQYIDSDRLVRLAQLESNRQDSSRSRVLAVVIYRLRRLLERCDAGYAIESMQGLGYRLARVPAASRKSAAGRA